MAAGQAKAVNYSFSDMGTIALSSTTPVTVSDISNTGLMSAQQGTDSAFTSQNAGVFDGTHFTSAGSLPGGTVSAATSINASGQTAGMIGYQPAQDLYQPTRWDNGVAVALQKLSPDSWFSRAETINASGQTAGYGFTDHWQASRWNADGSAQLLEALPGGSGAFVQGMNDAGAMVGDSYTANDDFDAATYWDAVGTIHQLPTLGGQNGWATSINNLGQITGYTTDADGNAIGVVWQDYLSAPTALTLLPGYHGAIGADVNNLGQILGWALDASDQGHLSLWENGVMTDLSELLPADLAAQGWSMGWYMQNINDSGVIAGGLSNSNGQLAAYMLTPTAVPVPGAAWLFGSAFAGLVGMKRRKQALAV
ncbi:hypothetical protein [Methylomonas sp. UP202]|uniref:hypothetical protein n=1 Tax=Methylomonas sp. UP202 TaxID=3040943 RepID=UPI00247AB312|nr:hypothetical protein [Methylomonas sp. UP202]WGS85762.1 hypothetical protein QC632_22430 [Methylomonas sp. UP202]